MLEGSGLLAVTPLLIPVPVTIRGARAALGARRAVAVHGWVTPQREIGRQTCRLHGREGVGDDRALARGVGDDAAELLSAERIQLLGELLHEEMPHLVDLFRRAKTLPRPSVLLRSGQIQEADRLVDPAGGELSVDAELLSDQRHELLPGSLFDEVLVREVAALTLAGQDCGHQYPLPLEPVVPAG